MSGPNGFNPLRWNCERLGCYNQLCRPKIEVFAECFPGRINFGDQDAGLVEINCRGLGLEFKRFPDMTRGQHLCYLNLSRTGFFVGLVVVGDPCTMEITHNARYIDGRFSGWLEASLESTKAWIRQWAMRASALEHLTMCAALPKDRMRISRCAGFIADYEAHQGEFLSLFHE